MLYYAQYVNLYTLHSLQADLACFSTKSVQTQHDRALCTVYGLFFHRAPARSLVAVESQQNNVWPLEQLQYISMGV